MRGRSSVLAAPLAVALSSVALLHSGGVFGAPATVIPVIGRHTPVIGVFGMLGFGNDQLLLWHGTGLIELRTSSGEWTGAIRLPIDRINEVEADGDNFLISGSSRDKSGEHVILSVDGAGAEKQRWTKVDDEFLSISVDQEGARAITRTGLVELSADGRAQSTMTFAAHLPRNRIPRLVVGRGDKMALCYSRSLAMLTFGAAECRTWSAEGWRFAGDFLEMLPCRNWIVTRDVHEFRSWSLETGQALSKRRTSKSAVAAYMGASFLITGDRHLTVLRLPTLLPTWRSPALSAAVVEIAPMRTFIAYRLANGKDIYTIPRPLLR
jgi:hypothetical protein